MSPCNENTVRQKSMPSRTFNPRTFWLTHLIFLGELEIVVGLEEFGVFGQLCDGDGRMIHHTCSSEKKREKKDILSKATDGTHV